ncbi:hypothetical protein JCM19000A_27040 [Silvimonas sp. JCM 19000]
MLALLQFALPSLHMAAASAAQHALVLCTGSGAQLVFAPAVSSRDAGPHGAPHDGVSLQPCPLCAHLAAALPPTPTPANGWLLRYVPVAAAQLPALPARRYAFEYRRGQAPPLTQV